MGRSRESGSVLLLAAIIVLVLAGLSAAFFTLTNTQSQTTLKAALREYAFEIAEAGLDETISKMNSWKTGNQTLSVCGGSVSNGSYSVTISPPFSGVVGEYTIQSAGAQGNQLRGLEIVVAAQASSLFQYAAFSDKSFLLDSNAYVDSYDSDVGTYTSQNVNKFQGQNYAKSNGDIGSNQGITLDSNAKVFGDSSAGPGYSTSLQSNAYVSGSTAPLPAPKILSPIVLPSAASLPSQTLNLGSNSSYTLNAGQYHFSSLTTDSNSSITIKGPATIVVDHFNTNSNSAIIADISGGPITVYGTGWFRLDSNTAVSSSTQKAADLQIYITTDNYTGFESSPTGDPSKPVMIGSNAALYAAVYAPNATVRMDSNGGFFGAIVGKKIGMDSNFGIHYDEALGKIKDTTVKYKRKALREFVPAPQTSGSSYSGNP